MKLSLAFLFAALSVLVAAEDYRETVVVRPINRTSAELAAAQEDLVQQVQQGMETRVRGSSS